jgi:hypothetical protein
MHLKVFLKLEKTLKSSLLGKKTKNNPLGWVFFRKNPGFFQPCLEFQVSHGLLVRSSMVLPSWLHSSVANLESE